MPTVVCLVTLYPEAWTIRVAYARGDDGTLSGWKDEIRSVC